MTEIILSHSHNQVTADSRMVAEHFEKRHADVIRSTEDLINQTSTQNCADLFIESFYLDSYGREQKCYLLTRDGFSLLVMGFTGAEALKWKLKYIEAFNKLEANQKPMSQIELIAASAQALLDMERRQDKIEKKIDVMAEALTPPDRNDWENDINGKVRMICKHRGINYQTYWQELYIRFEATTRVNLATRKNNKIMRMRDAGCKSKDYNAVSKLSIIAEDRQLKQIFENIVREEVARLALDEVV